MPSSSPCHHARQALLAAALVSIGTILSGRVARAAGEPSFHTTTTTIVEWHGDNKDSSKTNDDFVDFISRTNLGFGGQVLQVDMRLDTFFMLPFDGWPKEAPVGKHYANDYRLERLTGILHPGGGLKITAGDFYAQFGNGMALALRKVDELGVETVLRGIRIDGSWGPIAVTLLGGLTNTNNLDPQDLYLLEDPLDRIGGLRTEAKLAGGRLKLGLHGVWAQPSGGSARSANTWIAGGDADIVVVPGRLLLGAEFDWGWFDHLFDSAHPERPAEGSHTGYACLLNLRSNLGPVTLLLEGKLYDTFALEGSPLYPTNNLPVFYNQPPTSERIDQEVENSHTVVGGRFKIDWRIIPTLAVYANFGAGDYVSVDDLIRSAAGDKAGNAFQTAWYMHAYAGLILRWNSDMSNLALSGGYRTEREPEDFGSPGQDWREKKRLVHAEVKLNLPLAKEWTLHLSLLHEWRMKRELQDFELQPVDYHWGTHIVGVDWAGKIALSAAFEYDTDKATQDWYGWGEVKWFIRRDLILALLGGTRRGGLKCVGGVCKVVPSFAGVRMELVFRY